MESSSEMLQYQEKWQTWVVWYCKPVCIDVLYFGGVGHASFLFYLDVKEL